MTFLNIFQTGGLTLGLTLVWLVLAGIFGYQAYKAYKSGWRKDGRGGTISGAERIPLWKINYFWFAVVVTLLYIGCLFAVASDYR